MKKNLSSCLNLLALVILSLALIRCGGLGAPKYPTQVDGAMQKAFDQAEGEYRRKNYGDAIKLYRSYLGVYPYNKLSDESAYKIGKIQFIQGEYAAVVSEMNALARKSPDPVYQAKAYLLAGYAQYRAGDKAQALGYLTKAQAGVLPTKLQIQLFSLEARAARELGGSRRSLADFAMLRLADIYDAANDASVRELNAEDVITYREALQAVDTWVGSPLSPGDIPAWFADYPSGYSRPYIDYKWGKVFYEASDKEKARKHLSKYIHAYPKHAYADSARKLLAELGGALPAGSGRNIRVGVLLPLSGASRAYGESVLAGIRCAAGASGPCGQMVAGSLKSLPELDLIVKDSGSDPAQAVQMVEEFGKEDVVAIIGPMAGTLAEAAAKRAQDLKIVILPITQKTGVMGIGDYVFQMGYEMSTQINDLVSVARRRGYKSFGIFSPASTYGKEVGTRFREEARSQGGKIAGEASYNPAQTDLTGDARNMKISGTRYSAESGLAFQALFIPDSYGMLGRVLPALKFVSIDGIPLLGTNAWHDQNFPFSVASSFTGSLFVDLFYEGDSRPMTTQFVGGFRNTVGHTPTSIEALGFDAAYFIRLAGSDGNGKRSSKLRDALLSRSLDGVTGIRSFKQGSGPVVTPVVLTITESGFKQSH